MNSSLLPLPPGVTYATRVAIGVLSLGFLALGGLLVIAPRGRHTPAFCFASRLF